MAGCVPWSPWVKRDLPHPGCLQLPPLLWGDCASPQQQFLLHRHPEAPHTCLISPAPTFRCAYTVGSAPAPCSLAVLPTGCPLPEQSFRCRRECRFRREQEKPPKSHPCPAFLLQESPGAGGRHHYFGFSTIRSPRGTLESIWPCSHLLAQIKDGKMRPRRTPAGSKLFSFPPVHRNSDTIRTHPTQQGLGPERRELQRGCVVQVPGSPPVPGLGVSRGNSTCITGNKGHEIHSMTTGP